MSTAQLFPKQSALVDSGGREGGATSVLCPFPRGSDLVNYIRLLLRPDGGGGDFYQKVQNQKNTSVLRVDHNGEEKKTVVGGSQFS